jgi:hypothetical protein
LHCAALAGENPPKKIDVIAKVTAEMWESESATFKEECQAGLEREYQQTLKGWEVSLVDSPTRTPEEIAA